MEWQPLYIGPIASALSNRFGFRAVVTSGSVLGFLGLTCSSFVPSVDLLFLTIGLMCGVAFGLVWTPAVVAVSYFENRRSIATGVVMCGSGMGTFVFAPFIYWLLENYALRGTFLILVRSIFSFSLTYSIQRSRLIIDAQGALYLNCAVVGAFFHPVKKIRKRNDELCDVPTSDIEREAINVPMTEAVDAEELPKEEDANQVGHQKSWI